MYVYICIYLYICIYIYIFIYICKHKYKHTSIPAYMHADVHTCIHTCISISGTLQIYLALYFYLSIYPRLTPPPPPSHTKRVLCNRPPLTHPTSIPIPQGALLWRVADAATAFLLRTLLPWPSHYIVIAYILL